MQQHIYSKLIFLISFILLSRHSTFAQAPVNLPAPYGNAVQPNSVRSSNVIAPVTDIGDLLTRPLKDVRHTTQYIDGMGRLLQTVAKQGSMATSQPATDLV